MLQGKTVILGVSGGIAAYKIPNLASMLVKNGADVYVLMTEHAENFITATTFECLTGHKCVTDTFDRNFTFEVEHVALAKKADIFLAAPATANIIGKLARGICDDMLTTTALACSCPKLIAPAMNTRMYENPILQDNLTICRKYGMTVIEPASGHLACGDTGAGKMPEPEELFDYICQMIAYPKDLAGKKSAGDGRPDQGSHRSGSLHYQSFYRKNGICHCPGSFQKRRGCCPDFRFCKFTSSSLCPDNFYRKCRSNV